MSRARCFYRCHKAEPDVPGGLDARRTALGGAVGAVRHAAAKPRGKPCDHRGRRAERAAGGGAAVVVLRRVVAVGARSAGRPQPLGADAALERARQRAHQLPGALVQALHVRAGMRVRRLHRAAPGFQQGLFCHVSSC